MFKNPDNYEYEFWYVILNSANYADSIEKRNHYKHFIYLLVHLFPYKRCQLNKLCSESASYILYHVLPLYDEYLETKETLLNWAFQFQRLIEGKNVPIQFSNHPKDFGPHYWFVIHTCACNTNTMEKKYFYVDMMKNLVHLLPCKKCSDHAVQFVYEKNKPDNYCQKPFDLFKWSYDFHNHANDNTNVKQWERPKWEDVCKYYIHNFSNMI